MQSPSERPRVGVALSRQSSERTRQNYLEALESAGAHAVALFPDQPAAQSKPEALDALVLTGGGDVNPALYGQAPHQTVTGVDDERDAFEIEAIKITTEREIPILAICRGLQLLNVALDGSLEQHIESGLHRTPEGLDAKRFSAWHEVEISPGSWLAEVYGATTITTNSRHHQGIREGMLASDLTATAWTSDGYIEGVEGRVRGSWVAGVQWHPERVEADERGDFNQQSAAMLATWVTRVSELARKRTAALAATRK
jgi:putative glutamine amidotransferase